MVAIENNSPAAKAGLRKNDVVVAANGRAVRNSADVRNRIGLTPIGEEVDLKVMRGGQALQVRARWLAVGDMAPAQIDLADGDVVGLIKTYESMPIPAREQWLAIGRTLLSMHTVGKGAVVDPYPNLAQPPRFEDGGASSGSSSSPSRTS